MPLTMADHVVHETQEERRVVSRNGSLRRQFAVAVRSVQWSYAIFWSSSLTQHGVLEWGDGYYNGDIKKRKKSQAMELKAHKFGLQRSKQLRQLYLSMLEGDTATHSSNNNNTVLSPDDLSDEEWYYLVCMSYAFTPGHGLPGRALANNETIWLCNAQYAESKLFTRSLLARSASIQTVVCFPYEGGVIELGVTELIAEDHNLLQYIKACLLETSKPECHGEHFYVNKGNNADDENQMGLKIGGENSMLEENFREGDHQMRLDYMEIGSEEDLHYRRAVSAVLRCAADRGKGDRGHMNLDYFDSGSSFLRWENCGMSNAVQDQAQQPAQNVLRKILYNVPSMHSARNHRSFQKETLDLNQMILEGSYDCSDKRRENAKFRVLRSMVPTVKEIDKESILNDTIKYLRELEARVQELESCMGSVDFAEKNRTINHSAVLEETSDNYDSTKLNNVAETEQRAIRDHQSEGNFIAPSDVKVKLKETEVQIEIRCPYREYIVADFMDAVSNLHMDVDSVRSHTLKGFLTLKLKAKFRGAAVASAGMIKRELRKIAGEC